MKTVRLLLIPFVLIIFTLASYGQCTTCVPDVSCAGIKPAGGFCDSMLPSGIQGKPYDSATTLALPTTITFGGTGYTVDSVQLKGIKGLPNGLNWECDSVMNGCRYYPSLMTSGEEVACISVCGPPLDDTGTYTLRLDLVVHIDLGSGIRLSMDTSYLAYIFIDKVPEGDFSFSKSPPFGCDSLVVDYMAIIESPDVPVEYDWRFSDGDSSTSKGPIKKNYPMPGTYTEVLTTTIYQYIITDIDVTQVADNWCTDSDEPTCMCSSGSDCPDILVEVRNGLGALIYRSPVVDALTASYTVPDVCMYGGPYFVYVMDEDGLTGDDTLGVATFNADSAGVYSITDDSTKGTITIDKIIGSVIVDTQMVLIKASPTPGFSTMPEDSICTGDSTILSADPVYASYQWYNLGSPIMGANFPDLWAKTFGDYWVVVTDSTGCQGTSDTVTMTVIAYPPKAIVKLNSAGNKLYTTTTGYTYQWCKDGTDIPGANTDTLEISSAGVYSLKLTNALGCTTASDTMWVANPGIYSLGINLVEFQIHPNPNNGSFQLNWITDETFEMELEILDISGRAIIEKVMLHVSGPSSYPIQGLEPGFYLLRLSTKDKGSVILPVVAGR